MQSFKIEIEGQQFTNNYLVYIIVVKTPTRGVFYYVGQTGDRHYQTARPAFRRLAAHFSDQGYSTENQVYRALAVRVLGIKDAIIRKTFSGTIKMQVAELLSKSNIQMHVFPVAIFDNENTIERHVANREFSEKIEGEIMNSLILNGKSILNKKIPKSPQIFDAKTLSIMQELKTLLD